MTNWFVSAMLMGAIALGAASAAAQSYCPGDDKDPETYCPGDDDKQPETFCPGEDEDPKS